MSPASPPRPRRRWASLAVTLATTLVVVVVLACVAAPVVTSQDPQLLREYLGALPPGASHPDCLDHNRIAVGEAIDWCHLPATLGTLTVTTQHLRAEGYRVLVRRGLLEIRAQGGTRVPTLDLSRTGAELRAYNVPLWSPAPPLTLSAGSPPPAGLFPGAERAIAVRIVHDRAQDAWVATIQGGRVQHLTDNGMELTQASLDGDVIAAVHWAGAGGDRILSVRHWLGTDLGGRDVLSRLLYGGRISLMVGLVATVVSLVIGVLYGALSGYLGGRSDQYLMAGLDVLYAIPFMFIVILLLVYVGNGVFVLFVALGAVQWLTMARIVRGQVLSLMSREFILAGRALGLPGWRIILRHLIPNCAGLIAVYAALTVPAVILEESFLSFIGLTVQYRHQSLESWGALIKFGVDALDYHTGYGWWLLLFPALLMVGVLLALNLIGDHLRDRSDPHAQGR